MSIELGGLFALKLMPALFGLDFKITIFRLQIWSDMVRYGSMWRSDVVRCGTGPMWSDAVVSHTPQWDLFGRPKSV